MTTRGRGSAAYSHLWSEWGGVVSIAAGTFLLVTSEFLPIGLLTRLADGLGVSEGTAGLSVTPPAFAAAFAAPLLAVVVRGLDRRIVLQSFTVAIVASNVIGASAPDFLVFLASRLLLGVAVGGLWMFAVATGRRLVPEASGARATSVISAGISAGTVFGMLLGAVAGDWVGWRTVFGANAALGIAIVLVQFRQLPPLPASTGIDVKRLLAFAKVPMARAGLAASALVAAGHFIAYTYLELYLRHALGLGQAGVALTLAGYALAGITGSFAGERLAARNVRTAFAASAGLIGLFAVAAALADGVPAAGVAAVLAWGAAFGAVPVAIQIWMHASSPALYEAGSALMVSVFQIALSAGAALGGHILDEAGLTPAFLAGAAVSTAGAAVAFASRAIPATRPSESSAGRAPS